MLRKAPFVSKLAGRLEKLSPVEVQKFFEDFARDYASLEQILDQLEEGVVILDEKGMIEYTNVQARQWLVPNGRRENQKASEMIIDSRLNTWVHQHLTNLKSKVVENFQLISPMEIRVIASLSPLELAKEKKAVLILTSLPETNDSDVEQNFRLASLVRLSAGIAHEIGNPLNSIGIHLELLKKQFEGIPENKKKNIDKYLTVIKSETERLDHIVKNFLKATRRPPLRFKEEDLNQLLESAISFLEPELRINHIEVKFLLDPSLPGCLVDRERLQQVFINLIKNAMEAMTPKGKGRLEIRITHRSKAIWLRFKDDGIGIEEKDLPHIFDAYFTTKEKGSGLGLMTVYHIVREHGGRIEVASKPGKGSEFTIILPLRQPKLQLPGN